VEDDEVQIQFEQAVSPAGKVVGTVSQGFVDDRMRVTGG
jgi:hypothetical protein